MIPMTCCLIVKNESAILRKCLKALKKLPVQILVCDTGSTDDTVEIAREYADVVTTFEWCNDFSAARNHSISQSPTDWVLIVDADEVLEEEHFASLQALMKQYPKAVGQITRHNVCYTGNGNETTLMTDMVERIFNRKYYHYEGIIHEQPMPYDPSLYSRNANGTEALVVFDAGLHFRHEGYLGSREDRLKKAERNNSLLRQMLEKDPDDAYLYYQIGSSYMLADAYEEAYEAFKEGFCLDVDPDLLYVKMMITSYGDSMMQTGRLEEAEGLVSLQDAFGMYADYRCMMGNILLKLQKNEAALEQFQKALACEEHNLDGSNSYIPAHNIACIYEEALYNYDEAIRYYEMSLAFMERPHTRNRLTDLQKRMRSYLKKADISLCIICKNEEKNLAKCLDPYKDLPLEIIIVDTGSTDGTKEIAGRYTDKVYDFAWCNDFSKARNFSIEQASNDWILVIDCDEYARKVPFCEMMALKERFPEYVGCIERHSVSSTGSTTVDYVDRFFDRRLFKYFLPIHEQLMRIDGQPHVDYHTPLVLDHAGYATEELLRQKAERNKAILDQTENSPYVLFQAGHTEYLLNNFERAKELLLESIRVGVDPALEYTGMMFTTLGYCYLKLEDYEEGICKMMAFYDDFKRWSDFLYVLGLLNYQKGDIAKSTLYFMQATMAPKSLTTDTKVQFPNYYLGRICERLGDRGSARMYYEKCGSYAPALERLRQI